MLTAPPFTACFKAITGHVPLRWQERLFEVWLHRGAIPSTCDLPTGLGKTSVIPIWLIAVASEDRDASVPLLPRRLVYIVNRRTVVDQATDVVEGIRARLQRPQDERWRKHGETLDALCRRLRALASGSDDEDPLGVSTLRGELADNGEWKADPTRPAVIIGTIDMIGSKLLFSGYGDGRYGRVHHAGLIGQDALIVHDEAHLTPAFSALLRSIEREQRRAGESRSIHVMELSATSRGGKADGFTLQPEDEQEQLVADRLDAEKHLHLHQIDENGRTARIADLATAHDKARFKVLVYVRSPHEALSIANAIRQRLDDDADERLALLTGPIRGHERDQLVRANPVYRALLGYSSDVQRTMYLVSTSAGEVGIDLDADHMVCDLTTLDSMIQRLGRVNRRGGKGREARVDMVWTDKEATPDNRASGIDKAIASTLAILQRSAGQSGGEVKASPRSLRKLMDALSNADRTAAFSPTPVISPLTDVLLDAWSLTSIASMPGRPEVASYLHGLTNDAPETYVAWRREVSLMDEAEVADADLRDWFRACRIKTRERLRDNAHRVKQTLGELLKAHHKKTPGRDFPVALLDERGGAVWSLLSQIVEKDFDLAFHTVVLPVAVGGLDEHGMLDGKAVDPIDGIDVAEAITEGSRRERWLHSLTPDGERHRRLLSGEEVESLPQGLREHERITLKRPAEDAEGEATDLVLMTAPGELALDSPETARFKQTLTDHTRSIVSHMGSIVDRLGLEPSVAEALIFAAEWHDRGKDRSIWQRYARNPGRTEPLAKSTRYLHPRKLAGYRHEFGSLLEAAGDTDLRSHAERDLILHLIAAHHGHGRPHFEPRAFDDERFTTQANTEAAIEVLQRFARLQQRFGRWGLAWIESLLRCADITASKPAADIEAPAAKEEAVT